MVLSQKMIPLPYVYIICIEKKTNLNVFFAFKRNVGDFHQPEKKGGVSQECRQQVSS